MVNGQRVGAGVIERTTDGSGVVEIEAAFPTNAASF
jgi:hypothetical protein